MSFNPILCPVRNNLHLTRKAVKTFLAQDIEGGVNVFIVNNASTDGTSQYLQTQRDVAQMYYDPPLSVAASWNRGLEHVFKLGAEYALVVNNDVELRPDTYSWLVNEGMQGMQGAQGGFVTAVGTRDPKKIEPVTFMNTAHFTGPDKPVYSKPTGTGYVRPNPEAKRPHPDFSCYLIWRTVYEKVGPFDERFLIAFCEDQDYHVRMHQAGIHAYCIDLPFLHHGSATIKHADAAEVRKIQTQAERNRVYFKTKHGMVGASEEYYRFFNSSPPPPEP